MIVSITNPLKFDLPDELKTLGLSSVIKKSSNLLIDYNQKIMICTVFRGRLAKDQKID